MTDGINVCDLGRRPGAAGKLINVRLGQTELQKLERIKENTNLTMSDCVRALINRYASMMAQEGGE